MTPLACHRTLLGPGALLLLLALGVVSAAPVLGSGAPEDPHGSDAPAARESSAAPAHAHPQGEVRVGAIEGVVTRQERPQPRTANRYPGGATAPAVRLQDVPIVAFVSGRIPGVASPAPRTLQMAQQDSTFTPAAVVVPLGGTVAFPNRDPIFHNVFSFSPAKRFDLGRYPQGESKSVVFDQPGAVKIFCEVHDHMRSAVIVVENPFHAIVDGDGRFRIANVPAGTHTLVLWHADLDPHEVTVQVPEGGVARVQVTLN